MKYNVADAQFFRVKEVENNKLPSFILRGKRAYFEIGKFNYGFHKQVV